MMHQYNSPELDSKLFRDSLLRKTKIVFRNVGASALLPLARMKFRRRTYIPVLSYHRVLPDFPKGSSRTGSVSPEQFEDQMRYLLRYKYAALSLEQFEDIIRGRVPAPERSVLITFDDAYADNYYYASQIATAHGITINSFLPTGIIGLPEWPFFWGKRTPQEEYHMKRFPDLWRPLTWEEVRKMEQDGVRFGVHGYIHKKLSSLSAEELENEIRLGLSLFEEHMRSRSKYFSIPWGDDSSYSPEVIEVLRNHGVGTVFPTEAKGIRLPVQGHVFPRISIREQDDLGSFSRKLQGAHDLLRLLR